MEDDKTHRCLELKLISEDFVITDENRSEVIHLLIPNKYIEKNLRDLTDDEVISLFRERFSIKKSTPVEKDSKSKPDSSWWIDA